MTECIKIDERQKIVINLREESSMKIRQLSIILVSVLSLLTAVGCQQGATDDLVDENSRQNVIHVKNSDPVEREDLSNEQLAERLAGIAAGIPNVIDATAVVAGPYVVVGVDVDKDLDRSRVGTVKYSVAEALKKDPYGRNAIVMADADIMERLRHMGNKISQGYPAQGIVDELSAIVGRYMPEAPPSENQPKEPNENKEIMPEQEEEELDNIQNQQSKGHKGNKEQKD